MNCFYDDANHHAEFQSKIRATASCDGDVGGDRRHDVAPMCAHARYAALRTAEADEERRLCQSAHLTSHWVTGRGSPRTVGLGSLRGLGSPQKMRSGAEPGGRQAALRRSPHKCPSPWREVEQNQLNLSGEVGFGRSAVPFETLFFSCAENSRLESAPRSLRPRMLRRV